MFNLEDFKKYGKAVRRDGKIARFIAHIPDARREDNRIVAMDAEHDLQTFCEDGAYLPGGNESCYDLVEVVRPMINVIFSVPEPLSEEPEPGDTVYVLNWGVFSPNPVQVIWGSQTPERRSILMERGFVWKTMEEAQAAVEILKKGFRQ